MALRACLLQFGFFGLFITTRRIIRLPASLRDPLNAQSLTLAATTARPLIEVLAGDTDLMSATTRKGEWRNRSLTIRPFEDRLTPCLQPPTFSHGCSPPLWAEKAVSSSGFFASGCTDPEILSGYFSSDGLRCHTGRG